MDTNIYTVVIDFYEPTPRWGQERWFEDITIHRIDDGIMKLVDIHRNITYVPLNKNIANITITLAESGE